LTKDLKRKRKLTTSQLQEQQENEKGISKYDPSRYHEQQHQFQFSSHAISPSHVEVSSASSSPQKPGGNNSSRRSLYCVFAHSQHAAGRLFGLQSRSRRAQAAARARRLQGILSLVVGQWQQQEKEQQTRTIDDDSRGLSHCAALQSF